MTRTNRERITFFVCVCESVRLYSFFVVAFMLVLCNSPFVLFFPPRAFLPFVSHWASCDCSKNHAQQISPLGYAHPARVKFQQFAPCVDTAFTLCNGPRTVSSPPPSKQHTQPRHWRKNVHGQKQTPTKRGVDSTPHCSRVVPHPSTERAQTALTSVFG